MRIVYSQDFLTKLKNKYLLLDTNVFRDSANYPNSFLEFFNILKNQETIICTIDPVRFEILKGSSDKTKLTSKSNQIADITNLILPIDSEINKHCFELIEEYGIEGSSLSITDLMLGACLKRYKDNLFLMTRDTSDFIQKIFPLKSIVNGIHNKGILTYGIYQYRKD